MTVCVALASLIPILWETGVGSDVMKPIAAPIVGGIITSTGSRADSRARVLRADEGAGPAPWHLTKERATCVKLQNLTCVEQTSNDVFVSVYRHHQLSLGLQMTFRRAKQSRIFHQPTVVFPFGRHHAITSKS